MSAPSKPSLRSSSRQNAGLVESPATATHNNITKAVATQRAKRARRATGDDDEGIPPKRNRLAVQINARTKIAASSKVEKFVPPLYTPLTRPDNVSQRTSPTANGFTIAQKQQNTPNPLGLDPNSASTRLAQQSDKRTLRSQDGGSRFKSDLSLYFPGYDEMVSNEPKEPDFLTNNTPILVIDENPTSSRGPTGTITSSKTTSTGDKARGSVPVAYNGASNGYPPSSQSSSPKLNNAQRIDFSSIEKSARHDPQDPLPDAMYQKAHRRAERQEKQLRNIEKERAQHEKFHLERLLEGLKGHDWLRVMGISGITESEKKEYEPKRDLFIREVGGLIEKFKLWKEEEKRRKAEKGQPLLPDEATEGGDVVPDDVNGEHTADLEGLSDGDPPDYSDVDASAAWQLHQEVISATGSRSQKIPRSRIESLYSVTKPTPPPPPFTSFYSKPYLRAAAVGKHRRGRTRTAFGHPVVDVPEQSFDLPPEILTDEAVIANARSRRRRKRESKEGRDVPA
ncbi:MAG: hypothetical protein M1827_005505 [Pycnora praestabilis]|nr:MAG: hypothetical protein M1827_005505 [Pycnora praestabilis]